MFALFLLMQCCVVMGPHTPHHSQHPAEAELEHQKIKLIKTTEEKFKTLLEPTLEFDGTDEQIKNRIEIFEKERSTEPVESVEEVIEILNEFLKAREEIKLPEMDTTTNFIVQTNPFLPDPTPGAVKSLEEALIKLKTSKTPEHYNDLFKHLKAFWLVEKAVSKI
ncbi:unnamed protein product [Meloidogyne enterolobii]|uniref:Uncharacterized protein n=1 Tax=Meloidogyne enterolobii TaxID=390850 RepID=A0ACB1AD32_MELEN